MISQCVPRGVSSSEMSKLLLDESADGTWFGRAPGYPVLEMGNTFPEVKRKLICSLLRLWANECELSETLEPALEKLFPFTIANFPGKAHESHETANKLNPDRITGAAGETDVS